MGLFGNDKKDNNLKIVLRDDFYDTYKKKGYDKLDDDEYVVAKPKLYSMPDGKKFGGVCLTENILTVLPKKMPKIVEDEMVDKFRLLFYSTSMKENIGDKEYFKALGRLNKFIVSENDEYMLVKLNLKEMKKILNL